MMKLGEAANRLSRLDVLAPDGVEWARAAGERQVPGRRNCRGGAVQHRALTWLPLGRRVGRHDPSPAIVVTQARVLGGCMTQNPTHATRADLRHASKLVVAVLAADFRALTLPLTLPWSLPTS
jgi:hypothetical protein